MIPTTLKSPARAVFALFLALSGATLVNLTTGCSGNSTSLSAQFAASNAAPAPGLVKLVERSRSGSMVVVDVVIFGPEPNLDLNAFHFAVKIGNSDLVQFVPPSSFAQTALVAGTGQAIAFDVDGAADPSLVKISVDKVGGGAGNGFAAASAVVIELPFAVKAAGSTTLTLVGLGNEPPEAFDATRAPIAQVRFDTTSGRVLGVTTGGGGY